MEKTKCSIHKMYWNPCPVCKEIKELNDKIGQMQESITFLEEDNNDMEESITILSAQLDQATPIKEFMDPKFIHRLYNHDVNIVRGLLTGNSFMYNSLIKLRERIPSINSARQKYQWELLERELSLNWNRITDIATILTNDMSKSNWNRLVKEVNLVVQKTVDLMNSKDLGHWTVSKEGEYNVEFNLEKKVEDALSKAISSTGTNSLTAYSKKLLLEELTKIVEEK